MTLVVHGHLARHQEYGHLARYQEYGHLARYVGYGHLARVRRMGDNMAGSGCTPLSKIITTLWAVLGLIKARVAVWRPSL